LTAEVCHELSLHCLDLTDPFWQDFQKNKRRFNSVTDGHWNTYGHEVVAKAIEDFLLRNALFPTGLAGGLSNEARPFGHLPDAPAFIGLSTAQTSAAYHAPGWEGV
jgi:hypothetical protein